MHCIELFACAVPDEHVPPLPEEPAAGICAITGKETLTIAARHILGGSFTQRDALKRPDSDRVSVAAWRAWMYGWRGLGKKRDYRPERMSSWRVTADSIELLDRRGVREAVLGEPPATAWAGYATTSYKKHGSLLAPINTSGRAVWLWETRLVDCSDRDSLLANWERLRHYQDAGIPRPVLETGDPDPALARKVGLPLALEFREWALLRRESALYQFLCYLLPSAEELKEGVA